VRAQEAVLVERKWWVIRMGAYLGLSLPGFFVYVGDELMPVLLPSIMYLITAAVNFAASKSTLPDEKAWKWKVHTRRPSSPAP
jgi:hypothetical protein